MKNQLQCKVIMLSSKERTLLIKFIGEVFTNKLHICSKDIKYRESDEQSQHLYLTSNRKIEDGNYYIIDNKVKKADYNLTNEFSLKPYSNDCKRIEATTDAELGIKGEDGFHHQLPQIPQSFIEAYVKANGKIEEVNIEIIYECCGNEGHLGGGFNNPNCCHEGILRIKTREDNTVIIHQAKTYTREEVITLIRKKSKDYEYDSPFRIKYGSKLSFTEFEDKWIEENL